MNGLLTDLYELTMSAGYWKAGKGDDIATFELTIRSLPENRNFVITSGLAQVVEYLVNLRFTPEEIRYLQGLPQFQRVSAGYFDELRKLRFTGDLFAVPEGTVLFAGEPVLTLRAPLIQAQIAETFLLSTISYQTLVATKAARIVEAAGGRSVVEFGTRRAHSPQAGVLAGRAAYIGGCVGTSNTLTGFLYGVPVYGTAAHSWVMAFPEETEAFRHLQTLLGPSTIYIVDSYDTIEGTRKAISLGRPLWGVRLDSGNILELSKRVRQMLNEAGLADTRIMASGDLNEYKIRQLVADGAAIDAFGVGTDLVTSADAPKMGAVYKMAELESGGATRYTAKFSEDKISMPGAKQVFRFSDRDVIACAGECYSASAGGGPVEALLAPVIVRGELAEPLPSAAASRQRAARSLARLPRACRWLDDPQPYPVLYSPELQALTERVKEELTGQHHASRVL